MVEETEFRFEGTAIAVTISLGVAQWAEGVKDAQDLVRIADEKLYEAKNSGRNRVCG